MPRIVIPGPISGYIPFGHPDADSLYINEVEYGSFESFKFIKKLNQMGSFEIKLAGVESSDRTNIMEGKLVKIFNEYFLVFKGRIESVTYEQDFYCTIKGFGMETDLTKYEVTRQEYVSTNTTTIVKYLLSENMDGASPWIINEGVNHDWGDITLKGEYDNHLRYLSNLAETIGYDWWVSQDIAGNEELDTGLYSTANDYFHIDTRKGSSTSVKTFYTGGDNQNATIVNKEVDKQNMCNYVNILGYGEGINQVTASFYNASTVTTTLNETLTTTDTTITLSNASNFPSSGTARIESELVKYTGTTATDLTGCTRGSTQATSRAHPTGIFVEKYVTTGLAETGSSIGDNELVQRTFERRDLISQQAAQMLASDMLFKLKDPIVRIYLSLDDVRFTGVEIGDNVTVNDIDLGLNTVYRVVGEERGNTLESGEYRILECSNQSVSVMEDLADTTRRSDVETKYAMGTMTAENLSEKENIDATNDLDMLFYLPSDVIRINKALLSFKTKQYRAYTAATQTSSGGKAHSHPMEGVTSGSSDTSENTNYILASFTQNNLIDTSAGAQTNTALVPSAQQTYAGCVITAGILNQSGANDTYNWNLYNITKSTTLTSGTNQTINDGSGWTINGSYTGAQVAASDNVRFQVTDGVLGTATGRSPEGNYFLQIQTNASHTHSFTGQTVDTESAHTHSITTGFGITLDTLATNLVTVSVGVEGSEASTLTTTTTNVTNYDITSILSSSYIANGANWYNVNFAGGGRMRIEANIFLKYFIESKT